jgi:hypothetical protein
MAAARREVTAFINIITFLTSFTLRIAAAPWGLLAADICLRSIMLKFSPGSSGSVSIVVYWAAVPSLCEFSSQRSRAGEVPFLKNDF